jgi:hypothetical protein
MAGKLMASIVGAAMSHGLHVGFQVNKHQVFYKSCNEGNGCHSVVLPGLRAETLKVYSPTGYASDGQSVYYQSEQLEGVKAKTFHPLGHCWASDQEHLFRYSKRVQGADPSSFRPLGSGEQHDCTYGRDRQSIIVGTHTFPACDAATLRLVTQALGWQKDQRCVYFNGVKIPQADSHSVSAVLTPKQIFTGYVKDNRYVYFMGKVVQAADPKTFRMVSSRCARDRAHHYNLFGRLIASCPYDSAG